MNEHIFGFLKNEIKAKKKYVELAYDLSHFIVKIKNLCLDSVSFIHVVAIQVTLERTRSFILLS